MDSVRLKGHALLLNKLLERLEGVWVDSHVRLSLEIQTLHVDSLC
jgi:hypothetical protein